MLAFATVLATSALAEEAASPPSSDAKTTNSGTQPPDSSTADENKTPRAGGVNTEDIDTRITVQPHAPPGKPGKLGGTTKPIQALKLINPHRRAFSPSYAAGRISPNPSGILNGQRQILQHGPVEHFDSNGARLTPNVGTATGVGNANIGLAKPGMIGREPIFHSPNISPLGAGAKNHMGASVGGPASNHHAVGASTVGIGGPAHAVNGINGTSIRESR